MKKEMIERETPQNHVLYEEIEPLFGDAPHRDNRDIRRIVISAAFAVAAIAVCIACIWGVISISGSFGEGEGSGSSGDFAAGEGSGGSTGEQATNTSDLTEQTEESDTESTDVTESETYETQSEPPIDTGERDTAESDVEVTEVETVDISENERGDRYIINYTSKNIDIDGLLERGFVYSEQKNSQAPLVMIIHTHTSEQYFGDDGRYYGLGGVVGIGDKINTVLNARGLSAIHCTVIHDAGEQNAYLAARDTIKTMLEIYPSVKYVIDVHAMELKDQNGNRQSTVLTSNGAAQIRLTVGTDVKREGAWQDDLSLALALKGELNREQPRACAPVVVSHGGYNGDICPFYLMLDVGAVGNSTREAARAGENFAKALANILLD